MIRNIIFEKVKEPQEKNTRCCNEFAISYLYKNEFDLIVIQYNRKTRKQRSGAYEVTILVGRKS